MLSSLPGKNTVTNVRTNYLNIYYFCRHECNNGDQACTADLDDEFETEGVKIAKGAVIPSRFTE